MVIGNFLMGIEINDFWLGRHPLMPSTGFCNNKKMLNHNSMAPFKTNVHLQFDGSFQDKHTLFMFVRPTLQKHGQVFLFL